MPKPAWPWKGSQTSRPSQACGVIGDSFNGGARSGRSRGPFFEAVANWHRHLEQLGIYRTKPRLDIYDEDVLPPIFRRLPNQGSPSML